MSGVVVDVKLEGIEKLRNKLGKFPAKLDLAINRGIQKYSYLVENIGKQLTPVDTGRLRASITTNILPFRGTVYTNVNYAVYVHEGTEFMEARPFLREAREATDSDLNDIMREEIERALQ